MHSGKVAQKETEEEEEEEEAAVSGWKSPQGEITRSTEVEVGSLDG